MDLYLVRHAVAFDRDAARWPDDAARPLTPEGERDFEEVAVGLGRLAGAVEVSLSSPFVRAWRTAEILAPAAGWPEPRPSTALEADQDPPRAVEALAPHLGAASVAMVGHEPHLGRLASLLLAGSEGAFAVELDKGGAARLAVDGALDPRRTSLVWVATQAMLRAVARGGE